LFLEGNRVLANKSVKTTIYLEPQLLEYLHNSAKLNEMSMSRMLNDILRQRFGEDAEDLAAFEEAEKEPDIPFEEMVKKLKDEGLV
jgi:hypothetical protein